MKSCIDYIAHLQYCRQVKTSIIFFNCADLLAQMEGNGGLRDRLIKAVLSIALALIQLPLIDGTVKIK